jgi:hypothetical protein
LIGQTQNAKKALLELALNLDSSNTASATAYNDLMDQFGEQG